MPAILHGRKAGRSGLAMELGIEVLDRHVWCEMLVTSLGPCSIGDKSGEGDGIGGQYLVVVAVDVMIFLASSARSHCRGVARCFA